MFLCVISDFIHGIKVVIKVESSVIVLCTKDEGIGMTS
jgi:hypothetical protein